MLLLAHSGQAHFRRRDECVLVRLIPHLHQDKSGTLSVGGRQGRHMQTGYPYATSLEAAFVASLRLAEA